MQNALMYDQGKGSRKIGLIRENAATYAAIFDRKVDAYLERLRILELECGLPSADRDQLLDEITLLNDSMLETCAQLERDIKDRDAIKAARTAFRKRTDPIMSKSYLINRCRVWPQGQQGDYMTLELAYKNSALSEGIGYYLDKYLLATSLGIGVRERLETLRMMLQKQLMSRTNPKVLDVACGSCREVFELTPEIKASGAKFTCVDLDPDALNFSRDRLAYTGLLADHVELITYNALRMFEPEMARAEFGAQDIIYSLGFFDYLPDDFLVKMLRSLYHMLTPKGSLIAAFKDVDTYLPQVYHWLVDWDGFYQRTAADFARLLRQADIPKEAITETRVESGIIIFYTMSKQ